MKPFSLLSLIAAGLLPSMALAADTFVLENGERVEGEVVRETKEAYYVNIYAGKGIKEEKEILKSNLVRIVKPEAGLMEFEQLSNLLPTPDGLRSSDYKQRLELINRFIDRFPASRNIRKAMEMRDELREEMRQIEEGGTKIDGVIYPATEFRENEYELDALVEARKIKELTNSGQHLAALRAYDEFQKAFKYTQVHLDIIPLMQKLISTHAAQAARLSETYNLRVKNRLKGLELMDPGDRRNSERAIEEEKVKLDRRFRLEKSGQVGWVTVHPFCKAALDHTVAYAKSELRKIDDLLIREFTDCGKLYRELYQMHNQGADKKLMGQKLRTLQQSGVPESYLEKFALAGGR